MHSFKINAISTRTKKFGDSFIYCDKEKWNGLFSFVIPANPWLLYKPERIYLQADIVIKCNDCIFLMDWWKRRVNVSLTMKTHHTVTADIISMRISFFLL